MRYYILFLFLVACVVSVVSSCDFNSEETVSDKLRSVAKSMNERIESRYEISCAFLRLRNTEELELRLKYDRDAAASFENQFSNSFSIEYSPLSDFPRHSADRLFAIGLRRDIKLTKQRLEFEREHPLSSLSLIKGGCISYSED